MTRICFTLALCCVLPAGARAQAGGVTLELVLEQQQFLPNEELRVAARLSNLSGQTLHLGKDNEWLTFSVEALDRKVVTKLADVPVEGEFSLDSSEAGTKRVNLTPYFNFRQPGRYQVTATARIPQWAQAVSSAPKRFDIINGTKLREVEFGVPLPPGKTNSRPEVRKYVLQQATYLKEIKLYFRLTDASEAKTLRVFPIATMVSFGQPEMQLDKSSNLHVLNQTGARAFNYCVINPDGDLLIRQTHDYAASRPRLKADDDGRISVVGGIQRISANDLPSPVSSTVSNDSDAKLPKP